MSALVSHPQRNSIRLLLRQNQALQSMNASQWSELEPLLTISDYHKGDPLVRIYSPKYLSASFEYLQALESKKKAAADPKADPAKQQEIDYLLNVSDGVSVLRQSHRPTDDRSIGSNHHARGFAVEG